MSLFDQLWQGVADRFGQWAVFALVSLFGVLVWIVARLLWQKWQQFLCFARSRQRTLAAVAREATPEGPREGSGVWVTRPIVPPDDYENLLAGFKVLAIANLKGGVGKTTLSANIGACLASDWNRRVLLVDLDYQGSLSSMCFGARPGWIPLPGQDSLATKLISGDLTPDLVPQVAKLVGRSPLGTGRLDLVPAYYDLAQADNRLMIEWLLRCRRRPSRSMRHAIGEFFLGRAFQQDDVRYTLARLLHSKSVREAYDIVIVDCPPRLTTSEIQAFCAATHILIPTIFDRTSAEAVVSIGQQIETLRREGITPHIRHLGVVGTKWNPQYNVSKDSLAAISTALDRQSLDIPVLPEATFLPMTVKMVNNAAEGIAYLVLTANEGAAAREAIRNLTVHVAGQMGLPLPAATRPPPPSAPAPASRTPAAPPQKVPA